MSPFSIVCLMIISFCSGALLILHTITRRSVKNTKDVIDLIDIITKEWEKSTQMNHDLLNEIDNLKKYGTTQITS